jgi:hypothetical protein
MPTITFVVDGHDHVVWADRVRRDSQQYVVAAGPFLRRICQAITATGVSGRGREVGGT